MVVDGRKTIQWGDLCHKMPGELNVIFMTPKGVMSFEHYNNDSLDDAQWASSVQNGLN